MLRARFPLPPPRPVLHPLKSLSSATTTLERTGDGRLHMTIDHEVVKGISPDMLLWWFRNIGGTMLYAGQLHPRYLVWHPLDHIHWGLARPAPTGGADKGARFRIVEAFGRKDDCYIDSTETVEKLDPTGILLVRRIGGVRVFSLEHTWTRVTGGTHYFSEMWAGSNAPVGIGRLFNRCLLPRFFTEEMGRAWLQHNVEEVGLFEHILPDLYTEQTTSHA